MCQGENIMEDNRREEKEALKVLTEYSPKLLKSMRNVMEELHGNRQPDTDEYLLSIIKGMNWEIQVLNGTMDYLNEIEQLIDKQAANALFVNFSKIYQKGISVFRCKAGENDENIILAMAFFYGKRNGTCVTQIEYCL